MIGLLLLYTFIGMVWVAYCLERGRLVPKTYGDFIMTFISLPFVCLILFAFALMNPIDNVIQFFSNKENTKRLTNKITEFWNKELN